MPRKKKAEAQGMAVSAETTVAVATNPERVTMATEKEARVATDALREKFKKLGGAWFELGREVKSCMERQVPRAYGLATTGKAMNVADWMEICFPASVPKIYRALRIAKGLEKVPEERMKLLSEGNAFNLTRLPEELRLSQEWIDLAIVAPTEQFEEAVDGALEAKGAPKKEKWAVLFPKLPGTLKELYDATEKKLAEAMDLDLELHPEWRFQIWERVIAMLFQTGEATLREALVGDDGSAPPAVPA